MAIISQRDLFSWEDVENLGDLERLQLVLENLPDEKLMKKLEKDRQNGRDDHPVRAMWNSFLAFIVFQHKSIESLRRELSRNAQLRDLCGFDVFRTKNVIPSASAYTRFQKKLLEHSKEVRSIFRSLQRLLQRSLPSFGSMIACDSKAIHSHACTFSKKKEKDGRRDLDADVGKKTYKGIRQDGSTWEKKVSWFGYKLHLFVDATYELPLAYALTKASSSDIEAARVMIHNPHNASILKQCNLFLADKGYDDTQITRDLWDSHDIKTVIDIRDMWQDGEPSRLLPDQENVTYDYKGTVQCHCLKTGDVKNLAFCGFEKKRKTLKYRCPAKAYGSSCASCHTCPIRDSIRVSLDTDRRVFTPIARSSYKWKKLYKKRSSVERVNSRLDTSFGFEDHYVRGQKKMELQCCLSLCVMLSTALGRLRQKKPELMRSLVKAA